MATKKEILDWCGEFMTLSLHKLTGSSLDLMECESSSLKCYAGFHFTHVVTVPRYLLWTIKRIICKFVFIIPTVHRDIMCALSVGIHICEEQTTRKTDKLSAADGKCTL